MTFFKLTPAHLAVPIAPSLYSQISSQWMITSVYSVEGSMLTPVELLIILLHRHTLVSIILLVLLHMHPMLFQYRDLLPALL